MKYFAQLKYKKSLLKESVVSLRILAISHQGMWSKVDKLINTTLREKDMTFPNDALVIIDQSQASRVNAESLQCAMRSLPDILQGLSSKLNNPTDIIDATTTLPSILQMLSDSNLKAKVKVANSEQEIDIWKKSLDQQRKILQDRQIGLDDYKSSLEDSKQRMMVYANRIKNDRAALEAELKTFRKDRSAMAIALEHIRLEQKRLGSQASQPNKIEVD